MSPSKADTPASLPSHLPGTTNLHNFLVSTVVSNPRSRSCSQPFLIESPGHTPTTFSTDFPTVFATVFPTMFPNDYRLFSRPLSRLCSRTIIDCFPDRFPDYVPDCIPDYVLDRYLDLFPTGSMISSRPVPPKHPGFPSRPVNQMASRPPVPFPSRGKQNGTFSYAVAPEDPKHFPPAADQTVAVPYPPVPSLPARYLGCMFCSFFSKAKPTSKIPQPTYRHSAANSQGWLSLENITIPPSRWHPEEFWIAAYTILENVATV